MPSFASGSQNFGLIAVDFADTNSVVCCEVTTQVVVPFLLLASGLNVYGLNKFVVDSSANHLIRDKRRNFFGE
jgi:hypothetical protein